MAPTAWPGILVTGISLGLLKCRGVRGMASNIRPQPGLAPGVSGSSRTLLTLPGRCHPQRTATVSHGLLWVSVQGRCAPGRAPCEMLFALSTVEQGCLQCREPALTLAPRPVCALPLPLHLSAALSIGQIQRVSPLRQQGPGSARSQC